MTSLSNNIPTSSQGRSDRITQFMENVKHYLLINLILITLLFTLTGKFLQFLDPVAGILDIGILTVALFGLLVGIAAVLCSLWLQELLWQPFKAFRKNIQSHFNRLSSWQQCILYFSVFFFMLYAVVKVMGIVL
ncbi:hypothetical protein [Sphingobacterium tabacisoli]|uniref:Uncharacterized protein n=1 Tax=Sphingobacterium tabacisoli TaxID=2044855 RepID=A0ABW5L852_9SPHI|nr:hypothetical protein [Sphingobacterium tabacisoli]